MNYNQLDLKSPGVSSTLPHGSCYSHDMERFFHWAETCCGKQNSTLNGSSRKAHAARSHMTCHSLWKSLCVPEHEDWVKHLMPALWLLSFSILQKWVSNASDLRHPACCYQNVTNTTKLHPRGKTENFFPQFEVYTPSFRLNFWVFLPIPPLLILKSIFPHMPCS